MDREAECHQPRSSSDEGWGRQKEIESELYQFEFSVKCSLRYHQKRKRFFHLWRTSVVIFSFIGAMLTAYSINAGLNVIGTCLSIAIVLINACDLAFGFAKKEDLYIDLYRRFSDLLKEVTNADPTDASSLRKLKTHKIEIEKDEPPALKILNIICHNEEALIQGHDSDIYEISPLQSVFSQLCSFDWVTPTKRK